MFFKFTFKVISALTAFLYPGYASYKTLAQRPASEPELERWLMYWSVLGCIVAVEYVAEWAISWIPFYHLIKTLFLLYLALPQTQGATYLYANHLQPFFRTHEREIDAAIASLKSRAFVFLQEQFYKLWGQAAQSLGAPAPAPLPRQAANAGAPPSLGDPVSGPAQMLGSLWQAYGPTVMATGMAMMAQQQQPGASRGRPASNPRRSSSQSARDRRRQLEAELAALHEHEAEGYDVGLDTPATGYLGLETPARGTVPMPQASGSPGAGNQFEDIDVPSDSEGYDMRDGQQRRTSWFGWGGAGGPGYERVKTD